MHGNYGYIVLQISAKGSWRGDSWWWAAVTSYMVLGGIQAMVFTDPLKYRPFGHCSCASAGKIFLFFFGLDLLHVSETYKWTVSRDLHFSVDYSGMLWKDLIWRFSLLFLCFFCIHISWIGEAGWVVWTRLFCNHVFIQFDQYRGYEELPRI